MTSSKEWFAVDKEGLAKLVERRGKVFVLHELLQNAWDCSGLTQVSVNITPIENKPYALIVIEDDHPDGFSNLSHAYTLFAESEKKGDPSRRGRFNLGEKLVLAMCESAEIKSTTGTVVFDKAGRRQTRAQRQAGTEFRAIVRMTREELAEVMVEISKILPPDDVKTVINGKLVPVRKVLDSLSAYLPTEIAKEDGGLHRKYRDTTVSLYEVAAGEKPTLFEMGIPVMELADDPWHVNVQQKIPMGMERDAVTPYYVSQVRAAVLDNMHKVMSEQDARGKWATEALESSENKDAVQSIITKRYGEKVVISDPSDREGENIAKAQGYTVIPGGAFTSDAWFKIKEAEAALPAGQVTPSPKPFSPDGEPLDLIPFEKWTPEMKSFGNYTGMFARRIADVRCVVEFTRDPKWGFAAVYSHAPGSTTGRIIFNLAMVGPRFLRDRVQQNKLLCHELAHHKSSNHLSTEFHEAICELAAKAIAFALSHPEQMELLS